jgi:two-component system NtrC family sensor kinase
MPNGGILTVKTDVIKNSFIVSVSDTGCGIDPKDQEHLFEPFFTRKKDGTGLGLAITQGIVEKHRGRIAVRSRLGEGTTFEINLNQNSLN